MKREEGHGLKYIPVWFSFLSLQFMCFFLFQGESQKWSNHGFALLEGHQFAMAEKCAKFALYFHTSHRTRAQAFLCQVIARYEMGKITGETTETKEIKRLDPKLAKVR